MGKTVTAGFKQKADPKYSIAIYLIENDLMYGMNLNLVFRNTFQNLHN